ncbi:MAG: type III-A CRISPR-associated protein Csm2 [Candidatus Hydrogenedentales bacterium]|jgi:CRISPR-associated protein Csm2
MSEFAIAVEKGIDNTFVKWADGFGQSIARGVTTSQIRNIFGSVKKLEMSGDLDLPQLLLLKPKIAYARQRTRGLAPLADQLTSAIDAVDAASDPAGKQERFQRFCQGFEAILAYHRAHGGK